LPRRKGARGRAAPGASGRLLIIDDEHAIVSLLERVLPRSGFEVVCHTSPVEAMEHSRTHPDDFDIVITDRTMPRMASDDVAAEVQALRPGLPVIITSGQESSPGDEENEGDTGIRLDKPFEIADLLHAIEVAQRAARERRDRSPSV
jgi:DNA-binding NtrC family response regulator